MENEQKILYFQYTIKRLLAWYKNMHGTDSENDISTIKALKLLFFVTAVKASKNDDNTLVDNVFSNYVAMPYGHVEYDIYSELKATNGTLEFYRIDNSGAFKTDASLDDLDRKINTLDKLFDSNYKLIIASS